VRVEYGVWLPLAGIVGLMLLAIAVWIWLHERTEATAQSRSLMADRRGGRSQGAVRARAHAPCDRSIADPSAAKIGVARHGAKN